MAELDWEEDKLRLLRTSSILSDNPGINPSFSSGPSPRSGPMGVEEPGKTCSQLQPVASNRSPLIHAGRRRKNSIFYLASEPVSEDESPKAFPKALKEPRVDMVTEESLEASPHVHTSDHPSREPTDTTNSVSFTSRLL
ncbi:hypothetical protein BJ508DRAFT_324413 [Ascobolus immersus RN42]|uniref:Uncharacterized protein n=1 Tax=Ascobolus immersus RN42 TaxID=1160509 RepID=A0A3N4IC80_ASCIM|nr:hypothetical protein BJ508DRAFT_324413 [Ascobolus immersus RN42]